MMVLNQLLQVYKMMVSRQKSHRENAVSTKMSHVINKDIATVANLVANLKTKRRYNFRSVVRWPTR